MSGTSSFSTTPLQRRRRSAWRALYRYRWAILGVAAVLCLVLGFWGFRLYYAGKEPGYPDLVYITFALFRDTTTLYEGKAGPPFPWQLEVARLLAPLVIVVAGLSAVIAVFSDQFTRLRIRLLYRRHLVVCGLGAFGYRLATAFHDKGQRVVVIDKDPDPTALAHCRERLIAVIVADATDPAVLHQAGVGRAKLLVAVCGDNDVNGQIGLVATREFRGRDHRPECFIQIDDESLCELLEQSNLVGRVAGGVGVSYLNVFRYGPSVLLRVFPESFAETDGRAPHVVIVGTDPIGLRLVAGAVREWWFDHRGTGLRLRLSLVAPDAEERARELRERYEHFDEACTLATHAVDLADERSASPPSLVKRDDKAQTTVFVSYPDERSSLEATRRLAAELPAGTKIVVVITDQPGTIATLLVSTGTGLWSTDVQTFSLIDRVCEPELFVNNLTEQIAQALHGSYLEVCRRDGTLDASLAAHRPWAELDETYREANRAQAVGVDDRLRSAGYTVRLTTGWDVPAPPLTDDEIEVMAKDEHERWCRDRRADGWTYGPTRDAGRRRHPDLKGWDELEESVRVKNREIVRALPAVLARSGLAIVRADELEAARPA